MFQYIVTTLCFIGCLWAAIVSVANGFILFAILSIALTILSAVEFIRLYKTKKEIP